MNKFRYISRWLANVPSLIYFIAYFFCIPLYAFVYWLMPGHFYHSTLVHDTVAIYANRKTENIILSNIVNELENNDIKYLDSNNVQYTLELGSIGVHGLLIEDQRISFVVHYRLQPTIDNDEKFIQGAFRVFFPYPVRHSQRTASGESIDYGIIQRTFFLGGPTYLKLNQMFPVEYPTAPVRKIDGEWAWFPMNSELADRFYSSYTLKQGLTVGSEVSYFRTLYLSAVTITTLGYGDIVPVSTVSRFAVASQSVLGILLFGLFLNSLARENSALK